MATIRRGFVHTRLGNVLVRYGGRGRPVIVLHHTYGSSASGMRGNFLANLADSCFVVAPDTLGQGQSDQPSGRLNIEDYAENIVDVMTELGIENADLIGHHTGAAIALEIAADYQDRVGKLIFSGLPIWTAEERANRIHNSKNEPLVPDDTGDYLVNLWNQRFVVTDGLTPEDMHWRFLDFLRPGPRVNEPLSALYRYDALARLPDVEAKTLALSALSDGFGHRLDEVTQRLKRSETAIAADGTLFNHLDADAFLATVLSFLELG